MGLFTASSDGHNLVYTAGLTFVALYTLTRYVESRRRDVHVPSVGPSAWVVSCIGTVRYLMKGRELQKEAVQKYKGDTFKVPDIDRWNIVVNKPELVDEIQRALEDKLSFNGALDDFLVSEYTIGSSIVNVPYHVPVILHQLTRNVIRLFDDIKEEIELGFAEHFPASPDEWVAHPVYERLAKVVTRANSRAFVGIPFCRDSKYLDLSEHWTEAVAIKGQVIRLLPEFLRPIANILIRSTQGNAMRIMKLLAPTIQYRLKQFAEYGKDWSEKPNDLLQWLLEEAPEEERTVERLTSRILMMNFAGTHTTTSTFTMALFDLASRPEYIEPLREEIESIITEEGWSKSSMMKMRKLESFLKESQRYSLFATVTLGRRAMVDYTLSDGTFLPAGSMVSVNADVVHFNEERYRNATEFDGFRFVKEGVENNENSTSSRTSHLMVATSNNFLAFGHGRHACPGRFFAVNEMKTMMAYLLLNYDIKTEEGVRPKNINIGSVLAPDPKAKLLFRKRATKVE